MINSEQLQMAFVRARNYLESNKEIVNSLNVFPVPDGDTGTNMSLTMKSAIKNLENSNEFLKIVKNIIFTKYYYNKEHIVKSL